MAEGTQASPILPKSSFFKGRQIPLVPKNMRNVLMRSLAAAGKRTDKQKNGKKEKETI
jgi:hypothetical protein